MAGEKKQRKLIGELENIVDDTTIHPLIKLRLFGLVFTQRIVKESLGCPYLYLDNSKKTRPLTVCFRLRWGALIFCLNKCLITEKSTREGDFGRNLRSAGRPY